MNDQTPDEKDSNSSGEHQVPDPSGPPQAVTQQNPVMNFVGRSFTLLVAGGGLSVFVASAMLPTVGATCSSKLEWEQRQAQIDQAIQDEMKQSENASHPVSDTNNE
ncbi:MAG: hypothetical protein COA78_01445 [Blastopirellula sp.]|nr:MAG: hypothetical protein COA78_01445 [Blastopirellula sp.]